MTTLQEFSDQQEQEYYTALNDIKDAIDKFGPNIVIEAMLQSSYSNNVAFMETDEEDLTDFQFPSTMTIQ